MSVTPQHGQGTALNTAAHSLAAHPVRTVLAGMCVLWRAVRCQALWHSAACPLLPVTLPGASAAALDARPVPVACVSPWVPCLMRRNRSPLQSLRPGVGTLPAGGETIALAASRDSPCPRSTSACPSPAAPRRCARSPSTCPALAATAHRAALTACSSASPGEWPQACGAGRWGPCPSPPHCADLPTAMATSTWTAWAASRTRSRCAPPMTPTRRRGRAWRRPRRRRGAAAPSSSRPEAATWVSRAWEGQSPGRPGRKASCGGRGRGAFTPRCRGRGSSGPEGCGQGEATAVPLSSHPDPLLLRPPGHSSAGAEWPQGAARPWGQVCP
jgi:hypothetical protein